MRPSPRFATSMARSWRTTRRRSGVVNPPRPRRACSRQPFLPPGRPSRHGPRARTILRGFKASSSSIEISTRRLPSSIAVLAATLHGLQDERGLKTLMVSSTVPREGKTLTVTNLALTFSESYDRRVLVIDADLRRPSIHEAFGIPNSPGLADVIRDGTGNVPLIEVAPKLAVLTAGRDQHCHADGGAGERTATGLIKQVVAPVRLDPHRHSAHRRLP